MEQLSRKEKRKAERHARKERKQKSRQKNQTLAQAQRLGVYIVGILLLLGVGYWAYSQLVTGSPGEYVPSLGNRHVSPSEVGVTKYNSDPPSSGPHLASIGRWGIHENPIPRELQVHNLEDGGIMVQYNCPQADEQCKTLTEKLAQIVRRYDRVILAPYPGMSHKIALTAWTRIDKFDEVDEKRIVKFIDAYQHIDHHVRK